MSLSVLAFTGGKKLPSARYRVRQYIVPLRSDGIVVEEHFPPWGNRQPKRTFVRPFWLAGTISSRISSSLHTYKSDVTLFSRQALPGFIPIEFITKAPRILDVDDAIWLNRGGVRAKTVAKICSAVICGNNFLAEYFCRFNRRVEVLPTAIDTDRIQPNTNDGIEYPVIGWTGSGENLEYLYNIQSALRNVLLSWPKSKLVIVSDKLPQFNSMPSDQVEFVEWSPAAEQAALARMTVGLMPLPESEWARGKCSFKMLCYMAAGIPVVVSPVGMNKDVLALGEVGFGPRTCQGWSEALNVLFRDPDLANRMGIHGRNIVEEHFSVRRIAPRIAQVLRSVAS